MIKLIKPTRAEAQAVADACHQYLIDNSPEYAESVSAGQTSAWCKPHQSGTLGGDGVFTPDIPEAWFIWVDARVKVALPQADQDALWPPVIDSWGI